MSVSVFISKELVKIFHTNKYIGLDVGHPDGSVGSIISFISNVNIFVLPIFCSLRVCVVLADKVFPVNNILYCVFGCYLKY
jgi:hypothetical protein